jgi:hypothetical protein
MGLLSKMETVISLLFVSPLIELKGELEDSPNDDDEFANFVNDDNDVGCRQAKSSKKSAGEAVTFTAKTHAGHIVDILQEFYGVNVGEWVTNQTADSCSVNLKVARVLEIPHVNCESHLLNNCVKQNVVKDTREDDDVDGDYGIGTVLNIIHKTMKEIKGSIKLSSQYGKMTHLALTIGNDTR